MRVVSFVPSWTETLIEAGVNIVGRTRFCVHPKNVVSAIPILGGTKSLDIDKLKDLKPDLVIFDKEENKKGMAELCESANINYFASHVTSLDSCAKELVNLSELLNNHKLKEWAKLYNEIPKLLKNNDSSRLKIRSAFLGNTFGDRVDLNLLDRCQYVIWRNPFMIVNHDTFISDVLELFKIHLPQNPKRYSEIVESELLTSFCLFSTEPYPFKRDFKKLLELGFKGVLIDGEKISWYGIRNLRFLQKCLSD